MTNIISNGSRGPGEEVGSIAELCDVLKSTPLDPCYENTGDFVNRNPKFIHKEAAEKYKGCAQIFGNFLAVSHPVNIITDDSELIDRLEVLVRENQASKEYVEVKKSL